MRSILDGAYGVPTRYREVVLTVSKCDFYFAHHLL